MYCIVLTARTADLSFFQNPAQDRESNPHAILIRMQAEALLHTDTTPPQPNHSVTPTHIEPDTTHEVTLRISCKLLRMDVLTSETC